jgi:hypothetical protein
LVFSDRVFDSRQQTRGVETQVPIGAGLESNLCAEPLGVAHTYQVIVEPTLNLLFKCKARQSPFHLNA